MAYTSGFFDAVDQGGGNYDRVYSASSFAHYFSLLVKNGVFPDPSTGMQVKASSNPDMHVSVQPGSGWINGYYITVEDNVPEQLTVPTANSSLSRIDSVIMGLNYVDRKIQLYIKSGAVSASPSAVSLQRDNDLYELELAQITVSAGMASISQSSIVDMRQSTSRCGIVAGTIDQIDTEDLFAQYDAAFQTWFEDIKNNLSGDIATNLQNQINQLNEYNSTFIQTYEPLLSWGITYKKVTFKMRLGNTPVYGLIVKDSVTGRFFGSGDKDLTVYLNTHDLYPYGKVTFKLYIPNDLTYSGESSIDVDISDSSETVVNLPVAAAASNMLTFRTSTEYISFSSRTSTVTIWMCGGGGSGAVGRASNRSEHRVAGTGGSGAYSTQKTVQNTPGRFFGSVEIGAGGESVRLSVSGVNTGVSKGKDGSSTKLISSITKEVLMEALGGKGGAAKELDSDYGLDGVPGGSGSGGIYAASLMKNSGIGVGGSNGSDGASSGKVAGAGGKGQGTTTRPFGDSGMTLHCGAGGGAFCHGLVARIYGKAGSGGSDGNGAAGISDGTADGNATSLSPSSPGSGSGACVGTYNGDGTSTNTSAPGADGVCYMKMAYVT